MDKLLKSINTDKLATIIGLLLGGGLTAVGSVAYPIFSREWWSCFGGGVLLALHGYLTNKPNGLPVILLAAVLVAGGCAGNAQVIRALSCDGAQVTVTGSYFHLGTSVDPSTFAPTVGLQFIHGTIARIGRVWSATDTTLSSGSSVTQGVDITSGKPSTTNAGQGQLSVHDIGTGGVRPDCVSLATAPVKPK